MTHSTSLRTARISVVKPHVSGRVVGRVRRFGPPILAAALLGSTLFGQLFRVDLFQSSAGGLLVSDILVLLVAAGAVTAEGIRRFRGLADRSSAPSSQRWLILWLAVTAISTVWHARGYPAEEAIVGFGYLARLLAYYLTFLIAYRVFARRAVPIWRAFAYLTVIALALAAVILTILPDFSVLVPLGWDPHVGRLTGTWLDPNYFGNYLALSFAFFLIFAGQARSRGRWVYVAYLACMLVLWGGVHLTFSRSSLLVFLVAGVVVAVQLSWRTTLLVCLLFAASLLLPSRLQSRFVETYQFSLQQAGVTSGSEEAAPADPTGNARVESWKRAWAIFREVPLLGCGYNFYQYQQRERGVFSEATVASNRSASGSDSSLLTLLATTGIVGTGAFLLFWGSIVRALWRQRRQLTSRGALGVVIGWFASSFFNNTLLYAPLLLIVLILVGTALGASSRRS